MKKLITFCLTIGAAFTLQAQTFEMVKDINPSGNSNPIFLTECNGKIYFCASDGTNGSELWVSDGTDAGTQLLKDISPSAGDGDPYSLTECNGKIYFVADDGVNGWELWVSDGTNAGTEMLKNINPSAGDAYPQGLTEYDDKLYFTAEDGTHGRELWVTDGTGTGTQLLKDIHPSGGANPTYLTVFNGKLFFSAKDNTHGTELWVTDGTSAGTQLIDIFDFSVGSTPVSSYPEYLTVVNGTLYFSVLGKVIYKTDGTVSGTEEVKVVNPTTGTTNIHKIKGLFAYNNQLYFNADDGTNGWELWVSDGTTAGTQLLKDIAPADDGDPEGFTEYNGKLYFRANDGSSGRELWVTDGTSAGTQMVIDIHPSSSSSPCDFTEYNNSLYFRADDGTNGYELWITDGTAAGTQKIMPAIAPNANPVGYEEIFPCIVYDGSLYFSANYNSDGAELWKLTTAPTGIEQVAFEGDINVYPNPTEDYVNLSIDAAITKQVQFHIYDMSGRHLLSEELQLNSGKQTFQFDIEHLSSGSYFYQISNSEGAAYQSGKLIKQ